MILILFFVFLMAVYRPVATWLNLTGSDHFLGLFVAFFVFSILIGVLMPSLLKGGRRNKGAFGSVRRQHSREEDERLYREEQHRLNDDADRWRNG